MALLQDFLAKNVYLDPTLDLQSPSSVCIQQTTDVISHRNYTSTTLLFKYKVQIAKIKLLAKTLLAKWHCMKDPLAKLWQQITQKNKCQNYPTTNWCSIPCSQTLREQRYTKACQTPPPPISLDISATVLWNYVFRLTFNKFCALLGLVFGDRFD